MIPLDTIVATATPHGFGGVSVVRMSGPDSKNIIRSLSGRTFSKDFLSFWIFQASLIKEFLIKKKQRALT